MGMWKVIVLHLLLSCGKRWPGRPLIPASSPQFYRRSRLVSHLGLQIPHAFVDVTAALWEHLPISSSQHFCDAGK